MTQITQKIMEHFIHTNCPHLTPINIDVKNNNPVMIIANPLLFSSGRPIPELISDETKLISSGKKLKIIPEKAAHKGRVIVINRILIET